MENPQHSDRRTRPSKVRRGAKAALAIAVLVGGGAVVVDSIKDMDTGHHSAEVKQDLKDTLKPTVETLSQRVLDLAELKRNEPNYSVSIFSYEADGKQLTDTTIWHSVSDDSFTSRKEVNVTVDNNGNVLGISGSDYFQIGDSEPDEKHFQIRELKDEWRASLTADERRIHTGDQGLVGEDVGMYGDKRSDVERAVSIAAQATKIVDDIA